MKYRILMMFILLLLSHTVVARVSVSVDRDPVVVNESFQLIFESDEQINIQPDFSPLNQVFTIISRSSRTSTQIVNGNVKYSQKWILVVLPKSAGQLQVPSIVFGNEMSKPLTINVEARHQAQGGSQNDDIFLEVEVSTTEPYVQAEVIYTVKLYRAVATNDSNLTEPKISGSQAVINQLDSDKSYEAVVNGKRYGVFERRYAIFPQVSGPLTIEPVVFQGRTGADGGFLLFGYDGTGQQVTIKQSEMIQLDVKPIPQDYTGKNWLPAENITLQEQWSVSPDELKQGEVTTRTLSIQAEGMVASNLPAINESLPAGLKNYPDQPEYEEIKKPDGFTAIRKEKMAIIPTKSGSFVLPAIQIQWWNTVENRLETAELPERRIQVAAATPGTQLPPDGNTEDTRMTSEAVSSAESDTLIWQAISTALLLLWLATMFAWHRNYRRTAVTSTSQFESNSLKKLKTAVLDNAKKNDATATSKALIAWANAQWPQATCLNLGQLKHLVDNNMQQELDKLNAALYGKNKLVWHGDELVQAFLNQDLATTDSASQATRLEPLYKS
ncbi:MAG: BatD family protein [Gammaproteobacteria bacterium]